MAISKIFKVSVLEPVDKNVEYHSITDIRWSVQTQSKENNQLLEVTLGSWASATEFEQYIEAGVPQPYKLNHYKITKEELKLDGNLSLNQIYEWVINNDPSFSGGVLTENV